jgi:DNA-binding transcriptional regulator YiaG
MQAMRATLHKLRDLAGKLMLSSRKPSRRAQPDYRHAQTITNLRERLALLSITQSQFAQLCGVHPNTVYNWASGRTRMNHAALLVLQVLEANHRVARHVGDQAKGAPRGRPFAPGNPYRFGDKRRQMWLAGAQYGRAAA